MPELITLTHVADLIVDRVIAETKNTAELRAALENAYPFAEHPEGRQIWIDALRRHALDFGLPSNKLAGSTSDVRREAKMYEPDR